MDASISTTEDKSESLYARIEGLLTAKLEQHQFALEKIIVSLLQEGGSYIPQVPLTDADGFDAYDEAPEGCAREGAEQEEKPLIEKTVTFDEEVTVEQVPSTAAPKMGLQRSGTGKVNVGRARSASQIKHEEKVDKVWMRMQQLEEGLWSTEKMCCAKRFRLRVVEDFVESQVFNSLATLTIMVNAICIGWTSDAAIKNAADCGKHCSSTMDFEPDWAPIVEIVFTVIFTIELTFRLLAQQGLFFIGEEWKWNILDFLLVLASILDMVFASLGLEMTYVRLMRLLRMLRGARVVRLVRFFSTFRIMLLGVMNSFLPLIWACLLILLLMFVFAVTLLHGIVSYVTYVHADDKTVTTLLSFFDSLPNTLLSLYMAITGGVSWIEIANPLHEISWFYLVVFVGYVTILFLVALNVITATFVNEASDTAQSNREIAANLEMKKTRSFIREYKHIFEELDTNESGRISREEFDSHADNVDVRNFFAHLSIDVTDANEVFDMLDVDGTGSIELDEFVVGCMNIKGMAKAVNMEALMRENKRLIKKLESHTVAVRGDIRAYHKVHETTTELLRQDSKREKQTFEAKTQAAATLEAAEAFEDPAPAAETVETPGPVSKLSSSPGKKKKSAKKGPKEKSGVGSTAGTTPLAGNDNDMEMTQGDAAEME